MTIHLADKPLQNQETASRDIGGEVFVAHPVTGELHGFNEIGARIWGLLDGTRTVAEIVSIIEAEYETSHSSAESDTIEFLAELEEKDLITF